MNNTFFYNAVEADYYFRKDNITRVNIVVEGTCVGESVKNINILCHENDAYSVAMEKLHLSVIGKFTHLIYKEKNGTETYIDNQADMKQLLVNQARDSNRLFITGKFLAIRQQTMVKSSRKVVANASLFL